MSTRLRDDVLSTIQTFVLLAGMMCFFAWTAKAQSLTVTKVTPTTAALSVIGGDPSRSSVVIENIGSVNVALGGSTVTYATGMVIAPSQYLKCVGTTDKLYGIAQSGTADLRVIATFLSGQRSTSTPYCEVGRLSTTGGAINSAAASTVPMSDGAGNLVAGNVVYRMLTSAITANSTTCTDASGSLAITSNATGLGVVFRCDGTNYQLLNKYSDDDIGGTLATVATTGNTDEYVLAPFAGTFTGGDFSAIDALAANNTNYITFTITNLGQAGSGTNPLLAATAPNTTQVTGGTAIVAHTKFALTINGTGSNLIVAKGDRLRIRAAATGTLANTVSGGRLRLYFTRLS